MIGGSDIVFPAVGDSAVLAACARILGRHWPEIRFEDAITGDKYRRADDIPFGRVRDLLAYANPDAESAWDAGSPDSPENSMLYLLARPSQVTVVVDDPNTAEMQSVLNSIQELLWTDIFSTYARAA